MFAPNSKLRKEVVAGSPKGVERANAHAQTVAEMLLAEPATSVSLLPKPEESPGRIRLGWADLFRRVFAKDVTECPSCRGKMKVIAVIEEPKVVKAILRHLGEPPEVPMTAPARAPPQVGFDWPTECAASDWVEPA